ncbi:MAG: hypothetical protein NC340_04980 [Ruminococcus flavefaciens]|nr:hypothetical protein [Ruminococcus flavefaciens]MCM1228981.1 hypothetical protein [Ruminococcus flavefaciens]
MADYNEIYTEFEKWLNTQLKNDMPSDTKAFCFNLYEESVEDSVYSVQLVACNAFDPADPDWACEEVWSSEEDIFCIELSDEKDRDWNSAQKLIKLWVQEYMKNCDVLSAKPVAIGFVDGELEMIK